MKRLLLIVLVLASAINCQLYAQGATGSFVIGGSSSSNTKTVCINNVYYSLSGTSSSTVTSATVTSVDKNAANIYIPSSVTYNSTSYQVRNISSNAFKGCTELALISIDATWAYTLSRDMFDDCVNLRSISFHSIFSNRECSNDGILYSSGGSSVYMCPIDYKAEVIIPTTVNGTNVTSLVSGAFKNCRNVESISIPQYVTSFTGGFEGCDKLTTLEVATGNTKYCSDNGIVYSQDKTSIIAYPNAKEENYVTPSSVNSIASMAFAYSTKQRKIEIGENVKSIASTAFKGCTKTIITLKSKVGYKDYSFLSDLGEGCIVYMHGKYISQAKEYWNGEILPLEACWIIQTQKYLGAASFEIQTENNECQIKTLKVNEKKYDVPDNKSLHIDGLCPDSIYHVEISYTPKTGEQSTLVDSIETKQTSIMGTVKRKYEGALVFSIEAESDESVTPSEVGILYKETKYKSDNGVTIDNLIPGTEYIVYPYAIYNGKDVIGDALPCQTNTPEMDVEANSTQTTITVTDITITDDGTASYTSKGFEVDGITYVFEKSPITISNLYPDRRYSIYPYAICQGKKVYGGYREVSTNKYSPTCSITTTSSSVNAIGNSSSKEIEVTKETFALCTSTSGYYPTGYGTGSYPKSSTYYHYITDPSNSEKWIAFVLVSGIKITEGNSSHFMGLSPNTTYYVVYKVSTKGNGSYTYVKEAKTSPLILTTEQPKVVSMGNVIVSATTNVDPEEKNVGFEWRREDWSSTFASQSGAAVVLDGTMEGYIRNLYTGKLWNYCAYYLSDSGTYYYGDWVGIDPTNTSYFEPTVHTYADISTTGKVALIRGYVLNGTDKITVQGFKYWKRANSSNSLDIAMEGEPQAAVVSIPADAITETVDIVGAGQQLMNATLNNLDYGSTYECVAFATTSENETFYGEVQSFTTEADPTGIKGVKEDAGSSKAVTVVACYDINGKRLSQPQKGLNIIRMSDGTTRKVVR